MPSASFVRTLESRSWKVRLGLQSYSIAWWVYCTGKVGSKMEEAPYIGLYNSTRTFSTSRRREKYFLEGIETSNTFRTCYVGWARFRPGCGWCILQNWNKQGEDVLQHTDITARNSDLLRKNPTSWDYLSHFSQLLSPHPFLIYSFESYYVSRLGRNGTFAPIRDFKIQAFKVSRPPLFFDQPLDQFICLEWNSQVLFSTETINVDACGGAGIKTQKAHFGAIRFHFFPTRSHIQVNWQILLSVESALPAKDGRRYRSWHSKQEISATDGRFHVIICLKIGFSRMSRGGCYGKTNADWLISPLAAQLLPGNPWLFKRPGWESTPQGPVSLMFRRSKRPGGVGIGFLPCIFFFCKSSDSWRKCLREACYSRSFKVSPSVIRPLGASCHRVGFAHTPLKFLGEPIFAMKQSVVENFLF